MPTVSRCKCVVLGAPAVGKTALVKSFLGPPHSFPRKYAMTTGVEITAKTIRSGTSSDAGSVELFIYDFSGKSIYKELVRKLWAQNVSLIVGVFDVAREETFVELQSQLTEILKAISRPEEVSGILIGNKCDLSERRVVSKDEAHQLAKRFKMRYFDLSARDGRSDVEEAFVYLATNWYEARISKE